MKRLVYVKVLCLTLTLSIGEALAMEEEGKTNVASKPKQSSTTLIYDQPQEDPPFFLLKREKQELYILGSQHVVPIYRCLSQLSLTELERVATLKPVLYTEHEITNEAALVRLKSSENQIDSVLLENDFDLLYQISLPEQVRKEFKECVKEEHFLLNMNESSDVKIVETLKAHPWLGAVLLGTHAGLLSYKKYGGLETELENSPSWKEYWQTKKYLETNDEVLDIQKKHEGKGKDSAQNEEWAKRSVRSIIPFMKSNEEALKQIHNKSWSEKVENYTWKTIKFSKREKIPESAIERQELWAKKLLQDINKEQNVSVRFVVIGDGHLAGYDQGWSFLSFLNKQLNWQLLRFSNEKGWIKVY